MYIYMCVLCVYSSNVYIYISGQKWPTTHRVFKSHRSKMGVIYMWNHENNVPSRLSSQCLCSNSCTWAHGAHDWIYIFNHVHHFPLLLNPAIQRMDNAANILHPRRMEQDEPHPHFIFYCKLSKVTLDYIIELIKLNYSFNLPFKFSFKNIKMGSFSLLWWCTFKNSNHTFRSDTHASLQSLLWRWIW